jgi:hypothetical protein
MSSSGVSPRRRRGIFVPLDFSFEFCDEPQSDGSFVSSEALVHIDAEVSATDRIVRRLAGTRVLELEGHRMAS